MDKNTIIGFLLIGVVLIVFTWLNQPTPEQIEAQRRGFIQPPAGGQLVHFQLS